MEKKYTYKYFITDLADGEFNEKKDTKLHKLLEQGYKPLRETPVGNGNVLFVLSKQVEQQ